MPRRCSCAAPLLRVSRAARGASLRNIAAEVLGEEAAEASAHNREGSGCTDLPLKHAACGLRAFCLQVRALAQVAEGAKSSALRSPVALSRCRTSPQLHGHGMGRRWSPYNAADLPPPPPPLPPAACCKPARPGAVLKLVGVATLTSSLLQVTHGDLSVDSTAKALIQGFSSAVVQAQLVAALRWQKGEAMRSGVAGQGERWRSAGGTPILQSSLQLLPTAPVILVDSGLGRTQTQALALPAGNCTASAAWRRVSEEPTPSTLALIDRRPAAG